MLLCPADVDYHIDFICAVFNCLLCLCNLDWSGGISEGKANYGAYIDILIFVVNVIYKACRNAYRCSAVFQRLLCNGFNLLCCAKRLEERMVNVSVYFFFLQCYISFQLLWKYLFITSFVHHITYANIKKNLRQYFKTFLWIVHNIHLFVCIKPTFF